MDLVQEICEVENELSGLIYHEQTWGLSFRVTMRDSRSKGQGYDVLQKLRDTISEYNHKARHDADEDAFRKTEAFVKIAKNILMAPMETSIKIALFSKFNIMGYMFDRTVQNYLACNTLLLDFLSCLDKFKKNLNAEELFAWNISTFGGESQVIRFTGLLEGICFAAREFDNEKMIDPYKRIQENDAEDPVANENNLSIEDVISEIQSQPDAPVELKRELLSKAESIANCSRDYLLLGVYASHDDFLGDKSRGKVFFEKSLKKAISNVNAQINSVKRR